MGRQTVGGMICVALAFSLLIGCKAENKFEPPPPPEVTVAKPVVRDVVDYDVFTGETRAFETVEIRARVKGFLTDVYFTDGEFVEVGTLLYQIDPVPYETTVQKAESLLGRWLVAEANSKQIYDRNLIAYEKKAVTEQVILELKADLDQNTAGVASAQAELTQAKIELSYTKILSPIQGRVDKNQVDEGNLVGDGTATLLTKVLRHAPAHVYFDLSEKQLLEFKRGRKGADSKKEPVPSVETQSAIIEIFADRIDDAKTPAEKLTLATASFQQGEEVKDDFAAQYVYYRLASSLAAEAGDTNITLAAIDTMAETFAIDPWRTRVSALVIAGRATKGTTENQNLANTAFALAEQAAKEERFNSAVELMETALTAARAAQDVEIIKQAIVRSRALEKEAIKQKKKLWLSRANETDFPHEGYLDFYDLAVDSATGTFGVRGLFPNADLQIIPGLFVQVRAERDTFKGAMLVPDRAIGTDSGGKYVLIVEKGTNKVIDKPVVLGPLQNAMRVIKSGITKDDLVIVKGIQMARPGSVVNPVVQVQESTGESASENQVKPETDAEEKSNTETKREELDPVPADA